MTFFYSFLGWLVIKLWSATLRVRRYGIEKHSPEALAALAGRPSGVGRPAAASSVIFAFFHGEQFILCDGHRGRPIAIMTSLSRDGQLQNGILRRFGYETVRGSSSRGGARALIEMISAMRRGCSAAFAADGPRGPARQVKPGLVYLAAKTGAPIVPMRIFYSREKVLDKTWDKYRVPTPFSVASIVYSDPIFVDPRATEEDIARMCLRIAGIMEAIRPPDAG